MWAETYVTVEADAVCPRSVSENRSLRTRNGCEVGSFSSDKDAGDGGGGGGGSGNCSALNVSTVKRAQEDPKVVLFRRHSPELFGLVKCGDIHAAPLAVRASRQRVRPPLSLYFVVKDCVRTSRDSPYKVFYGSEETDISVTTVIW